MAKKIEHEGADGPMTLDELSAFVADAYGNGAQGDETVAAAVTLRGKLRSVKVNAPVPAERPGAER
ncbi:hypothetical protein OG331_31845 [Streptomyces sp. NBC_01017]|uniref:hypothetical protein n=1 Tax=Streptomyces sp. NBC_01017 TaxID=2903721 RepID=UPI003864102C|nr:hypothetical protein OG331_31845 [Streptomyces sp. NBC_01017]